MSQTYDLAIIGSGFTGSILAMIAASIGKSVILIERGTHPRFTIGESSTPLSNLLLEELANRYNLSALKPLAKWGSWQREYPHIACGLKRGFSFFHHNLLLGAKDAFSSQEQMLVAASPNDAIADTHWFRADVDHFLLRLAQQAGVDYQDQVTLRYFCEKQNLVELGGTRRGQAVDYRARLVVDATGPRGCLHQLLHLHETAITGYPATQSLYSHFTGVARRGAGEDREPPYPVDDAAVHHVFEGGWIWILRFNNGVTSAGVAATDSVARELELARGAVAWQQLLSRMPTLQRQFTHAVPVQPFMHVPRLAFQSAQIAGRRWVLLPSAAGFLDPLLSTGMPLALLGVLRLAELLESKSDHLATALQAYAAATEGEFAATARLLAALYSNTKNFAVFRALTLLYFAAASYSETARRLGKAELAKSFLLHDKPTFGPACRLLLDRARQGIYDADTESFIKKVYQVIQPIDVAGLTRPRSDHAYPVEANDLLASAWKVGASSEEAASMLQQSGFYSKGES